MFLLPHLIAKKEKKEKSKEEAGKFNNWQKRKFKQKLQLIK
jgi:hypothetical protein